MNLEDYVPPEGNDIRHSVRLRGNLAQCTDPVFLLGLLLKDRMPPEGRTYLTNLSRYSMSIPLHDPMKSYVKPEVKIRGLSQMLLSIGQVIADHGIPSCFSFFVYESTEKPVDFSKIVYFDPLQKIVRIV